MEYQMTIFLFYIYMIPWYIGGAAGENGWMIDNEQTEGSESKQNQKKPNALRSHVLKLKRGSDTIPKTLKSSVHRLNQGTLNQINRVWAPEKTSPTSTPEDNAGGLGTMGPCCPLVPTQVSPPENVDHPWGSTFRHLKVLTQTHSSHSKRNKRLFILELCKKPQPRAQIEAIQRDVPMYSGNELLMNFSQC